MTITPPARVLAALVLLALLSACGSSDIRPPSAIDSETQQVLRHDHGGGDNETIKSPAADLLARSTRPPARDMPAVHNEWIGAGGRLISEDRVQRSARDSLDRTIRAALAGGRQVETWDLAAECRCREREVPPRLSES